MRSSTAAALTGCRAISSSAAKSSIPIRDAQIRTRVRDEILAAYLADNVKARQLRADGSYDRLRDASEPPFSVQDFLIKVAEGKADISEIPKASAAPEPKSRPKRAIKLAQTATAAD